MPKAALNKKYGFSTARDRIFPPMVVVKITNVCDLRCIHCPHRFISKQADYKPKHMEWALYEKIVDEVSRYKGVIFRLLCDGEPLAHPRFPDMIILAKEHKIGPMNFITSGLRLDEQLSRVVLEAGVDVVEISLDALTKETYEKIRTGSNYESVMSNVHAFIELRKLMKAKTKIMVSIIDQPEAKSEIASFKTYWDAKVDRVIIRTFTTIGGLLDAEKLKIDNSGERWPCPQLWKRIFINCNGSVEFCVEDWYGETVIADLNTSSIGKIWNSRHYNNIRDSHLSGRFEEVPYCQKCTDWKAREWEYDYFYALKTLLGGKRDDAGA